MNPIRPLVVIGAGPAGIMAAITAAERGTKVSLLERKNQIGGKIQVTGNGKGNLTNINIQNSNYHSCYPEFIIPALSEFDFYKTKEFFEGLGLKLYIGNDGRVFPYSREAIAINKVLEEELKRLKVEIIPGADILEIKKIGSIFEIVFKYATSFYAKNVVLSTGGLAAPQLGSTGAGYHWAVSLGHHLEPQFPALVQLITNAPYFNQLNKLKLSMVEIRLVEGSRVVARRCGDLLFLSNGISGNSVFSLSRMASDALNKGKKIAIIINFTPDLNITELNNFFFKKKKSEPSKPLLFLLQGLLPVKLAQFILQEQNIRIDSAIARLTDSEIESIIGKITNYNLSITGTQSWKYAQITCGGVSVKDINPKTMESKIVPNLYFAGEIVDVDGDCGGYNLQWAWSSGYLAGKSAAEKE